MNNLNNAWKDANVFDKQLKLNLQQSKAIDYYPNHWIDFLNLIQQINPKNILDIGCGCGIFYKICKTHFENIKYTGIDYSEKAINIAKKQWKYDQFFVKNLFELDSVDIKDFDIIYLGAILDVMQNANEALEHILKLSCKNIIIGRIKITDKESYYKTYIAYDEIETCEFYHNAKEFIDLCTKYKYIIHQTNDSIHLKLQHEI